MTDRALLFDKQNLVNTFSYPEYLQLMETVVAEKRTTGPKQNADYAEYTRINWARMQRLNKTTKLTDALLVQLARIQSKQRWFVITEAWCGDAAQCVPVVAKAAGDNPNIELTLLLRDENPALMDQYLTNGGRSIPKLIVLDNDYHELFNWGPRPAGAQSVMDDHKNHPERTLAELLESIQKWYNDDKTLSIQSELTALLENMTYQPEAPLNSLSL